MKKFLKITWYSYISIMSLYFFKVGLEAYKMFEAMFTTDSGNLIPDVLFHISYALTGIVIYLFISLRIDNYKEKRAEQL